MCRSSNPTSDGTAPRKRSVPHLHVHFPLRPSYSMGYAPAYAFFATGTQVRLLLQNYVIHNLYTLFCVWGGFVRRRAIASLCDYLGHARKSHYEGILRLGNERVAVL